MSGTGGYAQIELRLRVIGYPDRPGIAKIMHGDMVLFDAEEQIVTDVTTNILIPFHTHFEDSRFAVAFRLDDNHE